MIEINGIVLPLPKKAKGFTKPEDISQRRWDKDKKERWERAYMHCLYSLPLHFELPLHSVVPRLAKKMLDASDPFNVSLRFIGEMYLAGYVELKKGFDSRTVVPTRKFLNLKLDCERAPSSAISYPIESGSIMPHAPIRGGISDAMNRHVTSITSTMAQEEFEVNEFILGIIKKFPPEFDKVSSYLMYERAMDSAELMLGKRFRFPNFLDSRARIYTDTTCGLNPQGADHEKSLVKPTHKEVLTKEGYEALLEAANGYSEQSWSAEQMALHATFPKMYEEEWKKADKPYCYLACAELISKYLADNNALLESFIPLDGRCSGLQHWSAVVRSNAITRHLGMHIDAHELDIYEKVADDWMKTLPKDMLYLATRKAAKIPVMTWGYNATMMTSMDHIGKLFGAKQQWNKIEGRYDSVGEGLDREVTSKYGVQLYRQLQETLGPLQEAVSWVSDCATKIASKGNVEIRWPTPDGFTCLQRKVKGERVQLTCKLSSGVDFFLEVLDFTKNVPNTSKHRSAIAPNIIHSLDATHLRMVARRLKELGLPMIFIHDSFATHCNYRKILYKVIQETFIELYSREYLAELKSYWEGLYEVELEDHPPLGDWEPSSLLGLDSFFM